MLEAVEAALPRGVRDVWSVRLVRAVRGVAAGSVLLPPRGEVNGCVG